MRRLILGVLVITCTCNLGWSRRIVPLFDDPATRTLTVQSAWKPYLEKQMQSARKLHSADYTYAYVIEEDVRVGWFEGGESYADRADSSRDWFVTHYKSFGELHIVYDHGRLWIQDMMHDCIGFLDDGSTVSLNHRKIDRSEFWFLRDGSVIRNQWMFGQKACDTYRIPEDHVSLDAALFREALLPEIKFRLFAKTDKIVPPRIDQTTDLGNQMEFRVSEGSSTGTRMFALRRYEKKSGRATVVSAYTGEPQSTSTLAARTEYQYSELDGLVVADNITVFGRTKKGDLIPFVFLQLAPGARLNRADIKVPRALVCIGCRDMVSSPTKDLNRFPARVEFGKWINEEIEKIHE